jgi:hypothetical protein
MWESFEFRLLGVAALAAVLGMAMVWNQQPEFDAGVFKPVALQNGATISVAQYEVTSAQWQACYDDNACSLAAKAPTNDMPMVGVNFFDVAEYLTWLNGQSATHYRLPTADEWADVSGGLSRRETEKLFDDPRLAWAADYAAMEWVSPKPRPSGAFGELKNGLSDLQGNVWEWTSTCVAENQNLCPAYVAGGLHEALISPFVRDPATGGCARVQVDKKSVGWVLHPSPWCAPFKPPPLPKHIAPTTLPKPAPDNQYPRRYAAASG